MHAVVQISSENLKLQDKTLICISGVRLDNLKVFLYIMSLDQLFKQLFCHSTKSLTTSVKNTLITTLVYFFKGIINMYKNLLHY